MLMDFPESFETEQLLTRNPLFGDSPELHVAVEGRPRDALIYGMTPKEYEALQRRA